MGKVIKNNFKIRENALEEANNIISHKISEFKKWLNTHQSNDLIKTYRSYIDDITLGAVIKAKKQIESGENLDQCLMQLAESLKNKLTHETTSQMRDLLPLLDDINAKKAKKIFKKT